MTEPQTSNWQGFVTQLDGILPAARQTTDLARRVAYSTNASFYTLIPKRVLWPDNTEEVRRILQLAKRWHIPVTFRAAGTSLSGQAISDSVLIMLNQNWRHAQVLREGRQIQMQPGLIGAQANRMLAPYAAKIGPDPASINTCKIGGIAANNASGMCCGVKHNTYHTLADMHLILADGTELSTRSSQSCKKFSHKHKKLLAELTGLRDEVRENPTLRAHIAHQFRLKNTMGYGLNALLDYDDPLDILTHLIIGSEGTLGFVAEITLHTIPVAPARASGLFIFESAQAACAQIPYLKKYGAEAVELMDSRALQRVSTQLSNIGTIAISPSCVALLVDISGTSPASLQANINQCMQTIDADLHNQKVQIGCSFTQTPETIERLWQIRKGLFPAVGAVRESGTTVVIEDIAFDLSNLAMGLHALNQLFDRYNYTEAIVFGHALDGNLHFVFTQRFDTPAERQRYDAFMQDVVELVADKFDGTLKAEHGTGRNMAPFLVHQWGAPAVAIMQRIKQLLDPENILNPGVIFSDDSKSHLQHLKALPPVDPLIDNCIECGFCEPQCPSKYLTVTPRQRIALMRRMSLLTEEQQKTIKQQQTYLIDTTCAATSMCATSCPVNIDTGAWVKKRRSQQNPDAAAMMARHLAGSHKLARSSLTLAHWASRALPVKLLPSATKLVRNIAPGLPEYFEHLPKGAAPVKHQSRHFKHKVIYLPSCANRIFGAPETQPSLTDTVVRVFNKAGYEVIVPEDYSKQCCGQPWRSKGNVLAAEQYEHGLAGWLEQHNPGAIWPVITDASSCALQCNISGNSVIQELTAFVMHHVIEHLTIYPTRQPIMLHTTCSSTQLDRGKHLRALAKQLCSEVIEPEDIKCCGFAGDKGLTCPQLNESALATLPGQIPATAVAGYSNNRSCELGLSKAAGLTYSHIVYLLDKQSESNYAYPES